eukprot:TRINITY_DN2148_c0_g1_i2.p1 TRINITY_DN2148_c0_g1~~TRINITY_DN2148_c0_g1_i2.p1  ORF type:complete len:212 (+),score=19.11 TRINITY_DN2148_c0_g1_i2:663-1298(+)
MRRTLKYTEDKADGTFWMCFEDYINAFNRMQICRLYHDQQGKIWHRYLFKGNWDTLTAGGCTRYEFSKNTQYGVKVSAKTPVFISLTQKDARLALGKPMSIIKIGFLVCKTDDFTKKLTMVTQDCLMVDSGPYINQREVSAEVTLSANEQYVIIPSTYLPNEYTYFCLCLYSSEPIFVHCIRDDGAVQQMSEDPMEQLQGALNTIDIRNYK